MSQKSIPFCDTALTDTAVLVRTGRCSLTWYHILNTTVAELYVLFFDAKIDTDVTLGTTVADFVLGIPAETGAGLGAGACIGLLLPIQFTKGIVVGSLTTASGAGHTGAISCVTLGVGD